MSATMEGWCGEGIRAPSRREAAERACITRSLRGLSQLSRLQTSSTAAQTNCDEVWFPGPEAASHAAGVNGDDVCWPHKDNARMQHATKKNTFAKKKSSTWCASAKGHDPA